MDFPGQSKLLVQVNSPSPEQQLRFLQRIQRLLTEGDFTATYKFALLISLCDLAVERWKEGEDGPHFSFSDIGRKFIELYWTQVTPYMGRGQAGQSLVLVQNRGAQAAIVNSIAAFREANPEVTLAAAIRHRAYPKLLASVSETVKRQPIAFLQNLGGVEERFLFDTLPGGITLRPGVAFSLRSFQPLIQQLARQKWVDHIKCNKRNAPVLGDEIDLAAFLFETSRTSLDVFRSGLQKIANGKCFYCGSEVTSQAHADHFVPFILYPRDLAHNLVYAHAGCNISKSDTLASIRHLERWLAYIDKEDQNLAEVSSLSGIPADRWSSRSIAEWGYRQGFSSGSLAWLKHRDLEPITKDYVDLFS